MNTHWGMFFAFVQVNWQVFRFQVWNFNILPPPSPPVPKCRALATCADFQGHNAGGQNSL